MVRLEEFFPIYSNADPCHTALNNAPGSSILSTSSFPRPSIWPSTNFEVSCYSTEWQPRIRDDLQDFIKRILVSSFAARFLPRLRAQWIAKQPQHGERPMRVSLLHTNCDPEDTYSATCVASTVAILFGAIHCIAWNFIFLTPEERTLWRIWSIIITAAPLILLLRCFLLYILIRRLSTADNLTQLLDRITIFSFNVARNIRTPSIWITATLVPVYIIARCSLLIQSLIALRDLQATERAQVNWVDLLPHV